MTTQKRQMTLPRASAGEDPIAYMNRLQQLVGDEFNRLADDFYRFRTDVEQSGSIALNAPTMVTAVADQYSVDVTWENPGSQPIEPTEVHIRIVGVTPWAEFAYPKSDWTYSGLLPGNTYTVEVKLVSRYETTAAYIDPFRTCPVVPVQRLAESNAQPRSFVTLAGVGPPTNGGDGNIDFDFPPTEGDPGVVGSADCWWEYGYQAFSIVGDTTVVWTDVGSLTEVDGDIGTVTADTTDDPPFTPGTIYRMKYREVCDGVPGPWQYTLGFPVVDWAQACAGVDSNASLGTSPYDSADLWAIPGMCQKTGQAFGPIDALTATDLTPFNDGLAGIFYAGGDMEWTMLGKPGSSQTAILGNLDAIGDMNDITDYSFAFDVYPTATNILNSPQQILKIANLVTVTATEREDASIYATGTGIQISVSVPIGGGLNMVATTPDVIPLDEWTRVVAVVRAGDGTALNLSSIDLFVGSEKVTTVTKQNTLNFLGADDSIRISLFDQLLMRKVYGWGRALADDELIIPLTTTFEDYIISLGPLRYMPLRANSPLPDRIETVSGNQVSTSGTPGFNSAVGPDGNYLTLDGSSSVRFGHTASADYDDSPQKLVVFFAKPASLSAQSIYEPHDGSRVRGDIRIDANGRLLQRLINVSNFISLRFSNIGGVIAGDWHMYACSFNSSAAHNHLRDASSIGSTNSGAIAATVTTDTFLDIGRTYIGDIAHMMVFTMPGSGPGVTALLTDIYNEAVSEGWF